MAKLVELDMFLQVQVHETQLLSLLPMLERSRVRLLIDHCRPGAAGGAAAAGLPGAAYVGPYRSGRRETLGLQQDSRQSYPFEDMWPYVHALVDAFTLDHCLWASDWPFIHAPDRVDYLLLLKLVEQLFPDPKDRSRLFWDTPLQLFGFAHATAA